jgi:hypothetical protein
MTDEGVYEGGNEYNLTTNRNYIYGVVWSKEYKKYYVFFAVVPKESSYVPKTDWSIMLDYFQYGTTNKMFRRGILGQTYPEARIVADYLLKPSTDITSIYNDIMIHLAVNAFGLGQTDGLKKVEFHACSAADKNNPIECIPSWTTRDDTSWTWGGSTYGLMTENNKEKILVYVDADDSTGNHIDNPSKGIPASKYYRIIVQQWYRGWDVGHLVYTDHFYDEFVRSISIIKLSKCSQINGACETAGICHGIGGSSASESFECAATGEVCCV